MTHARYARLALRLLALCGLAAPALAQPAADARWTRIGDAGEGSLLDEYPLLAGGVRTPAGHALVFPTRYGAYRTDDGGDSWTRAEGGRFPTLSVREAVATPDGVLWAATWEDGVWRSADDGRTWTPAGLQVDAASAEAPAPYLDGLARLADGALVAVQNTGGVHQLAAGASGWEPVGNVGGTAEPPPAVYGLAVAPDGALLASTGDGVRRSEDGGQTWAASGLPGVRVLHNVAFGPDGAAYAGGWFSADQALDGVYRSDDGGRTWARAGLGGDRVQALTVTADGAVLAGLHTAGPSTGGLWRSADGGQTWAAVYASDFAGSPPVRVRPRAILLPTDADPRTLLPSTIEGVYRSEAGLEGWGPAPGALVASKGVGGLLSVGALLIGNRGYFAYTDGGALSWSDLPLPGSPLALRPERPMAVGPDGALYTAVGSWVYRADDLGGAWTQLGGDVGAGVTALLVSESARLAWTSEFVDPERGEEAVLWRYALGEWAEVLRAGGGPTELLALPGGAVLAAVRTTSGAGDGVGVWRSDDGGAAWARVLDAATVALAVGPDGTAYAGSGAGVWRSVDGGRTWAERSDRPSADLAVTPDGALFAAWSFFGVARSTDGGATWAPATDGLDDWRVQELHAAPSGTLYLSTDEAVFRYEGATGGVAAEGDAPGGLELTASPNPARGAVRVRYGVAEAGPVRAAVYDALGREVAVLVDGDRAAGPHEAALDAGALAPGVYVVRLDAGGHVLARPLTVVR